MQGLFQPCRGPVVSHWNNDMSFKRNPVPTACCNSSDINFGRQMVIQCENKPATLCFQKNAALRRKKLFIIAVVTVYKGTDYNQINM